VTNGQECNYKVSHIWSSHKTFSIGKLCTPKLALQWVSCCFYIHWDFVWIYQGTLPDQTDNFLRVGFTPSSDSIYPRNTILGALNTYAFVIQHSLYRVYVRAIIHNVNADHAHVRWILKSPYRLCWCSRPLKGGSKHFLNTSLAEHMRMAYVYCSIVRKVYWICAVSGLIRRGTFYRRPDRIVRVTKSIAQFTYQYDRYAAASNRDWLAFRMSLILEFPRYKYTRTRFNNVMGISLHFAL